MTLLSRLEEAGFSPVMVLSGADCGLPFPSLVLAFASYEAEAEPDRTGAWIHPYYPVSQWAYRTARALAEELAGAGEPVTLRDDIRLKPILARIPGIRQGRNTLSYLPGVGSRFHVQTFAVNAPLPPTVTLLQEAKAVSCGACRRCMEACPGGAVTEDGFRRENCLRNWQLSGKPVPARLRHLMGNRLLGCDDCQRCCPMNPPPAAPAGENILLEALLKDTKQVCAVLRERIGSNMAIPNRVLAQAALLARCSGDPGLQGLLQSLQSHPSALVRDAAEDDNKAARH